MINSFAMFKIAAFSILFKYFVYCVFYLSFINVKLYFWLTCSYFGLKVSRLDKLKLQVNLVDCRYPLGNNQPIYQENTMCGII